MSRTIKNPELTPKVQSALQRIITHFPTDTTTIRDTRGQSVHTAAIPPHKYIIKKYTIQRISSRIIAALHHSRAERSFRAGIKFKQLQIPTPEIHLAHITTSTNPPTAFAIFAHFDGIEMPTFIKQNPDQTQPIISQVAAAIATMAQNKISHGDLHAKNILIDQNAKITIIDLDGVRFHKFNFRHRRRYTRDRNRLISSTAKHTDQTFANLLSQQIPTSP